MHGWLYRWLHHSILAYLGESRCKSESQLSGQNRQKVKNNESWSFLKCHQLWWNLTNTGFHFTLHLQSIREIGFGEDDMISLENDKTMSLSLLICCLYPVRILPADSELNIRPIWKHRNATNMKLCLDDASDYSAETRHKTPKPEVASQLYSERVCCEYCGRQVSPFIRVFIASQYHLDSWLITVARSSCSDSARSAYFARMFYFFVFSFIHHNDIITTREKIQKERETTKQLNWT